MKTLRLLTGAKRVSSPTPPCGTLRECGWLSSLLPSASCLLPSLLTVVPAALAMSLMFTEANLAQVPSIEIKPKLQSDPLVLSGKSGGSVPSNCGNISAVPNQVIQVTDSMPYLRLTVESQGKPTLLIDGPGGRFCVLGDNYSGGRPEISGFWLAGKYSLYVGDSSNKQYSYVLSISQQKLPKK